MDKKDFWEALYNQYKQSWIQTVEEIIKQRYAIQLNEKINLRKRNKIIINNFKSVEFVKENIDWEKEVYNWFESCKN